MKITDYNNILDNPYFYNPHPYRMNYPAPHKSRSASRDLFIESKKDRKNPNEIYNKETLLRQKKNRETNVKKIVRFVKNYSRKQKEAQDRDLVSPQGDLGLEKTSQRLFKLASSLSYPGGSSPSLIRQALIQGLEEAEASFGPLPDLSKACLDLALEKFDTWLEAGAEI